MAEDILKTLLQIPIPEKESAEKLEIVLDQINKHEADRNVPIDEVLTYLNKLGVPDNVDIKYLGILVQSWIDDKRSTEVKVENNISDTIGGDLTEKINNLEERDKLLKGIRSDSNKQVRIGIDKKKELYEEQIRQIELELNKQKEAQAALKDKKIGVKIINREETNLNQREQELLDEIKQLTANEIDRKRTIDVLSKKAEDIFSQSRDVKSESPEGEVIARAAVVGLIAQIHKPIKEREENALILSTIGKEIGTLGIINEDVLETARKSSVALALQERSSILASRQLSAQLLGTNITNYLYGGIPPLKLQLIKDNLSKTDVIVDLEALNTNYGILLEKQKNVLKTLIELDSPEELIYSSIANFSEKKAGKIDNLNIRKKINEGYTVEDIIKKFNLKLTSKGDVDLQDNAIYPWVKILRIDQFTSNLFSESIESGNTLTTASSILGKVIKNTTAEVKTRIISKKSIAAFFTATGLTVTPFIAWIGSELFSKFAQWWNKNKEITYPLLAGLLGFAMLPLYGPVIALSIAGIAFVGLAGTGAAVTAISAGLALLRFLWVSLVLSFIKPLIFVFVIIPVITVFILFIINNGAYVVPYFSPASRLGADNPYMLVTKIASPTKMENPTTPQEVIYAVSIQALKESLFNVRITSVECTVIKKDGKNLVCPDEDVPPLEKDKSISPTQNHAFSFISRYDSRFSDSLVLDTVEVTAETADGTVITTSGSASVCIGDCPRNCAEVRDFADTWPSSLRKNVEEAIAIVSGYQGFTAKLCPQNKPVYLCYKPSAINEGYYAWHVHNENGDNCDIYFNSKGVGSDKDASFMITHELTHHIQAINGDEQKRYESSGGYSEVKSNGFCTYKDTAGSASESMAEAAALFVNSSPSWDSCASNYKSRYPKNYIWAEAFMTK